ncbi:MAG: hypothetical protein K2N19_04230, partial [Muribaculaceae bacterium]|nr:hypothetical protein [Muribaculaceae bacterium]
WRAPHFFGNAAVDMAQGGLQRISGTQNLSFGVSSQKPLMWSYNRGGSESLSNPPPSFYLKSWKA